MKQFTIPSGGRDIIPELAETRIKVQRQLEKSFESWGYRPILTPTIEYYKTYENGFEKLKEEEVYKFFDSKGRILMLREDMTIPIARVVATKFKDAILPLRFYYTANVFKVHQELAGLQNEITDCGVELIGECEKVSEIEILLLAQDALQVIENRNWFLEIGNINFFRVACDEIQLNETQRETLSRLIDNKSMTELAEFLNQTGLDSTIQNFFLNLPLLSGDVSILESAHQIAFSEPLKKIIEDLNQYYLDLSELMESKRIHFDLGKVTNLNYYTGLIFEAFVEGVGSHVLTGGSYNRLIGQYGKELEAIGFSIKLESLMEAIENKQETTKTIVEFPVAKTMQAMKVAREIRKSQVVEMKVNKSCREIRIKENVKC